MNRTFQERPRLDIPRPGESLPDRFAQIVRLHHPRQALVSEAWNPTYGELNAAADRLAGALLARGGQPGDRIALLMQHDAWQIAAMLAILKAGRIVVSLNPSDAPARLRLVVEDAAPALVLGDARNVALAGEVSHYFCDSVSSEELDRHQVAAPKVAIDPKDTAFIVYTSGSSGRPKGVMMNHHQVMHNALRLSDAMELHIHNRVALLPSLSGLHGVNNTWCALLHGASLHPFPVMERGVTGLAKWMTDGLITAFSASTSLFRSFMKSLPDGHRIEPVRMIRVGGELVTSDDFRAFRDHFHRDCILLNTLASSEAGNVTSLRFATTDEPPEGSLAVGRVFEGMEIAITDERGRPVGPGEAGQIVVMSPYMSQGYWRNAPLTAERYSHDGRGVPMLKSGDWGRINADGILEFIGRKDTRVKIHGSSVELDEVEQALCRAPGVDKAVVCPWEGPNGTQLVAYVLLQPGRTPTIAALRRAARALLPEHMVPSIFALVRDLPLTPHGKVDRQKLLQTHPPKPLQRPVEPFRSETEAILAAIWAEAFDIPSVGRDDDFFELGGDSLIASVVAARLYGETGAEFNLEMFSAHPTVARMAVIADQMRQAVGEEFRIRPVSRDQPLPLSFAQERIWTYVQDGSAGYAEVRRVQIRGPLDIDVLHRCLNYIVGRHELFRTTFADADGRPFQVVHPQREAALSVVDLAGSQDPTAELQLLAKNLISSPMDLRNGPLVRFIVAKVADCDHTLLQYAHHILCDGVSWKIFQQELAELYSAFARGSEAPLPPSEPLQYADYAAWQRQFFRADVPSCRNMISWWKRAMTNSPRDFDLPFRRHFHLLYLRFMRRFNLPLGRKLAAIDPRDGFIRSTIAPDTSMRLIEIARQQSATAFQVGLAMFVAFLAEKIGRQDLVVGTYATTRRRPELERMFGDFSNLMILRFRFDPAKTFRSWIVGVRDAVTEALAHSEVPHDELHRSFEQDGRTLPKVRIMFTQAVESHPIHFAGLELTRDRSFILRMPWGFTLSQSENYSTAFVFDAGRYESRAIRAMAEQWAAFRETVANNPDLPLQRSLALSGADAEIPMPERKLYARLLGR